MGALLYISWYIYALTSRLPLSKFVSRMGIKHTAIKRVLRYLVGIKRSCFVFLVPSTTSSSQLYGYTCSDSDFAADLLFYLWLCLSCPQPNQQLSFSRLWLCLSCPQLNQWLSRYFIGALLLWRPGFLQDFCPQRGFIWRFSPGLLDFLILWSLDYLSRLVLYVLLAFYFCLDSTMRRFPPWFLSS